MHSSDTSCGPGASVRWRTPRRMVFPQVPGALCGGNIAPGAVKSIVTNERNMALGLQGWTKITYVLAMRKLYKPSFNQCLLKLAAQAIGGEGVERRERSVCGEGKVPEAGGLRSPWRVVEF